MGVHKLFGNEQAQTQTSRRRVDASICRVDTGICRVKRLRTILKSREQRSQIIAANSRAVILHL